MSWEQRPYSFGHEPQYGGGGGGLRSWFGGLPAPGPAVKWIALVNIGLFVLCLISGGAKSPIFSALEMRTDLVFRGQIWRLFTFSYLHSQFDIGHLLFNMIGLYFLGMPLERHLGTRRFFVFYTVAGIVSVLMYVFVTAIGWLDFDVPIVGASGGVLAVLGAVAVLFPAMQVVLVLFLVPIRTAAVIFGVLYVFNLATRGANAGGDACHLAGLAFGIVYGYRGHRWTRAIDNWRINAQRRTIEAKRRELAELEATVDQILDKVHRTGIGSLTKREKQILEDASRKQKTGGPRF